MLRLTRLNEIIAQWDVGSTVGLATPEGPSGCYTLTAYGDEADYILHLIRGATRRDEDKPMSSPLTAMRLGFVKVEEIVKQVKYKDWFFHVGWKPGVIWLQVRWITDGGWQHGRKWLISEHATKSEVVQTCLKAVLTAEEHEARERLTYRDVKVFDAHFDVDWMVDQLGACPKDSVDTGVENAKG